MIYMTYFEYINQLVTEFHDKKADAQKAYDALIQSRNYLDRSKRAAYLAQVNDCCAVADLAECLMQDILAGLISPFEPID
jgi:hypothetical protein